MSEGDVIGSDKTAIERSVDLERAKLRKDQRMKSQSDVSQEEHSTNSGTVSWAKYKYSEEMGARKFGECGGKGCLLC